MGYTYPSVKKTMTCFDLCIVIYSMYGYLLVNFLKKTNVKLIYPE